MVVLHKICIAGTFNPAAGYTIIFYQYIYLTSRCGFTMFIHNNHFNLCFLVFL